MPELSALLNEQLQQGMSLRAVGLAKTTFIEDARLRADMHAHEELSGRMYNAVSNSDSAVGWKRAKEEAGLLGSRRDLPVDSDRYKAGLFVKAQLDGCAAAKPVDAT